MMKIPDCSPKKSPGHLTPIAKKNGHKQVRKPTESKSQAARGSKISDAAQERIKELEQRLDLILSSADEGICGIDPRGRIAFANPKAAELLGWPAEQLLGRPHHEIIHGCQSNGGEETGDDCVINIALRKPGIYRVTNDSFRRKDGSSFCAEYIAVPITTRRGSISGAIVTFRDISERVAADARLKLQEQQYRLLFQSNPNAMWVFELGTLRMLAVNEAALAQYEYTEEEFLKLRVPDLRAAAHRPNLTQALSAPNLPAHFTGEFEHHRKNGSHFWVEIHSSPVIWDGVSARMTTSIDCTKRKEAEARLRKHVQVLDEAHDAIMVRNFDDRLITFWNRGAERLYGWTAAEAVGRPIDELILPDPSEFKNAFETLITKGEFRGEFKALTKEKQKVVVEVSSTLIGSAEDKTQSVVSIHTDVTQQKKFEQQFLRAQRLESIGTLASGVAHDLNNIIAPIIMLAPLLRDPQDMETRDRLVELIETSANRGARLVNQVLTFARGIEGDRVLLQPEHVILEVARIAEQTFPKNITVRTSYHEGLWAVEADPTQLHQILLNLCLNARDAMPNGGVLTIGAENFSVDSSYAAMTPDAAAGAHVLLTVADTGVGMSREMLDKIFEPFFTTKESGKGTGLGLSTVLGIVKSHSGWVNVYSEPGNGSTVRVFLPSASRVEEAAITIESEAGPHGAGETILVVDDEEPIRRVTQTILSQHNYYVLTAADGPEALAVFARRMHDIPVVVTDIAMPYMDGVTLARALKRMKPNVQVIANTGHSDGPQPADLDAAGIAVCLSKPYKISRLLQTLQQLLHPI